MRKAGYLIVLTLLLTSFAVSADAQRRRTPRRPAPKPAPAKPQVNPDVTAARQKVANQLHNVNVFVDRMGPIAVAIETADKDAAARRLRPEQVAANDRNKKGVVAAISGLRTGLVALETEFRTKPVLAQYLPRIQGISTLCSQAEDSAIAGRFVAAKEPLRQIALKLNETLAVLPGGPTRNANAGTTVERIPTPSTATSGPGTTPASRIITVSNSSTPAAARPASVAVAKRDAAIGMTTQQVLESTWGAPASKRTSTSPNGTTEVWTYSGDRTIYFYNGKVTRIVK